MSASLVSSECKLQARDLSLSLAVKIVSFVVFAFEVLMT